jgi:deoxyribodipyrimidine photo-lyase
MATKDGVPTYLIFVFDSNIIDPLPKDDRRITFIYESLIALEKKLNQYNSSLIIRYGDPLKIIPETINELKITDLFFNRDYEPSAKKRDHEIEKTLSKIDINVFQFKDHVFYEKHEVLKEDRSFFKVFTAYKNKWIYRFESEECFIPVHKTNYKAICSIGRNTESILNTTNVICGGEDNAKAKLVSFLRYIDHYHENRDFPARELTSELSTYIRMGNISIRTILTQVIKSKSKGRETFISELIWRDFYQALIDIYPNSNEVAIKSDYQNILYENNESYFLAWTEGKTGFPIIDSAMRCLNETGLMHNRLRMITASFLVKTLLIDWRLGEKYFASKLLDYDMAANVGGWQWCASTGTDAQPYFRIFNPYNQHQKFDPDSEFVNLWCPELKENSENYPNPIVNYKVQRLKALKMYKLNG